MPLEIGIISDTHGFFDPRIVECFESVDEIWHAGDFGSLEVGQQLEKIKPLRGVYGNIDETVIRQVYPEDLWFELDGVTIWMTHIAGRPGRYDQRISAQLKKKRPDVLVCGHSHILLVEKDEKNAGMLYLNPGAAGHQGSHHVRTLMKCQIDNGQIRNMRVIELGPRGRMDIAQRQK